VVVFFHHFGDAFCVGFQAMKFSLSFHSESDNYCRMQDTSYLLHGTEKKLCSYIHSIAVCMIIRGLRVIVA
jgi:hypothetical protein